MGVIQKKLRNLKKAVEYYNKSIKENNTYPYSFLNKSVIYIEQGKIKGAIDTLTEGIEFNPYAEYLYYNRACCYAKLNKKDEAFKDLRKAIILLPEFINIMKEDGDLESLYDDERFMELINKVKKN